MDGGFHSVVPPVGYAGGINKAITTTAVSTMKGGREGGSQKMFISAICTSDKMAQDTIKLLAQTILSCFKSQDIAVVAERDDNIHV